MAEEPSSTDPDSLSSWAEEEGNIQLALADDRTFKLLLITRLTELSGRVRNLEHKTNSHTYQIACVEDRTQDTSGSVKAILAVGGAFLAIAALFGGLFAWLWSAIGGGK